MLFSPVNIEAIRPLYQRAYTSWQDVDQNDKRVVFTLLCLLGLGIFAFLLLLFSFNSSSAAPAIIVNAQPAVYSTLIVDGKPTILTHNINNSQGITLFREQGWTCVVGGIALSRSNTLEDQIRRFRDRGYGNNCIPGG